MRRIEPFSEEDFNSVLGGIVGDATLYMLPYWPGKMTCRICHRLATRRSKNTLSLENTGDTSRLCRCLERGQIYRQNCLNKHGANKL